MRRPIAFDLSRAMIGVTCATPRGIDRVDQAFATRIFGDDTSPNVGLAPSLLRMNVLEAGNARGLLRVLDRHWETDGRTGGGSARRNVVSALRLGRHYPWSPMRMARHAVPHRALYINTGQMILGWPWFFGWLESRPDIASVFMMHDTIPLIYPEYTGPVFARHHARAVATIARHATALLATSEASAGPVREALARQGRTDVPIAVVPLPLDSRFFAPAPRDPPVETRPYVVAVGILDQRKNHLMLLQVWRDLVRQGLSEPPMLLIVGASGLRTAELHDLVARSPGLAAHVRILSGLSTEALRDVVMRSRALLMPSFAEGFGLPVAEALALGVPVIASDLAAHREVAGGFATYLDPIDGAGWRDAVLAHVGVERPRPAGYAAQTSDTYFAAVMPFLDSL